MNVPLTNCIYCSATDNLNIQLSITLEDGTKIQVLICDAHAEEASVKTARAAFSKRQQQIQEFMAQAQALGLQLAPSRATPDLVLASATTQPPPAQPPTDRVVTPILADEDGMVETGRVDRAGRHGMVSVGGLVPAFGTVPAYQSHIVDDVRQQIPVDALKGKVKLEQVEDRAGRQISIPTKRIDGLGTTHIRVVNTGGDQALQRRFKNMAQATIQNQHPGFAENYDLKPCPVCKGMAIVHDRGQEKECPKCGGEGVLSLG
jgi:hypothetical protein